MDNVSPRLSNAATPEMRHRLLRAGEAAQQATVELRSAVQSAANEGVSVREIATLANVSTNTVQRWKRDRTFDELASLPPESPMTSTEAEALRSGEWRVIQGVPLTGSKSYQFRKVEGIEQAD